MRRIVIVVLTFALAGCAAGAQTRGERSLARGEVIGHVDRALALLRAQPATDETRTFMAASLEDAARAAAELRAARAEADRAWALSAYPVRWYPRARGGLVCL